MRASVHRPKRGASPAGSDIDNCLSLLEELEDFFRHLRTLEPCTEPCLRFVRVLVRVPIPQPDTHVHAFCCPTGPSILSPSLLWALWTEAFSASPRLRAWPPTPFGKPNQLACSISGVDVAFGSFASPLASFLLRLELERTSSRLLEEPWKAQLTQMHPKSISPWRPEPLAFEGSEWRNGAAKVPQGGDHLPGLVRAAGQLGAVAGRLSLAAYPPKRLQRRQPASGLN